MTIEIFAWWSTRELFVTGMTTTTFPDGSTLATLDDNGNLIPHEGVIIDEIGPVTKTPAVINPDGSIQTPAVMVPGFHVNLMATGAMASMLTAGCPAAGTIFERTNISSLMPGMKWDAVTKDGVPAGFVQPDTGVRLFDPAEVKTPARVFL